LLLRLPLLRRGHANLHTKSRAGETRSLQITAFQ
jgi:hypothetical protein